MFTFLISNKSFKNALYNISFLIILIFFAKIVGACNTQNFLKLLVIPLLALIISTLWFCLPMLRIYRLAHELTKKVESEKDKAIILFEWVVKNIEYDDAQLGSIAKEDKKLYKDIKEQGLDIDKYLNNRPPNTYDRNDVCEVFYTKKGICGQQAMLLDTLYKAIKLDSHIVEVLKDCDGNKVNHACVCLTIDNNKILVDSPYKKFGILHKETKRL